MISVITKRARGVRESRKDVYSVVISKLNVAQQTMSKRFTTPVVGWFENVLDWLMSPLKGMSGLVAVTGSSPRGMDGRHPEIMKFPIRAIKR